MLKSELILEVPSLKTRSGGSKFAFLCRRACSGGPRAQNTSRGFKVGVFMAAGLLRRAPGSKLIPGAQSLRFYVGGLAPQGPWLKTHPGGLNLAFLCRRACSGGPRAQNTLRMLKVGVFTSASLLRKAPGPKCAPGAQSWRFYVGGLVLGSLGLKTRL